MRDTLPAAESSSESEDSDKDSVATTLSVSSTSSPENYRDRKHKRDGTCSKILKLPGNIQTMDEASSSSSESLLPYSVRKRKRDTTPPKNPMLSNIPSDGKQQINHNLPKDLQLPGNIPTDVYKTLKYEPNSGTFYKARVILVRLAVRFYAALCPYPRSEDYIAIIEKLGTEFPHLRDPNTSASDNPRTRFVGILAIIGYNFNSFL